jgi:glycosyltransferase involved in cell wall biosynthesis
MRHVRDRSALAAQPPALAAVEFSVVIPCLNERQTLGDVISSARRSIESLGISAEIVVADNGSSDGSPELAAELGARVVRVHERGYGAALMGGVAAARGEYVLMGDSDGSYDFTSIAPFIESLRDGCDVVVGNRFAGGIAPGAMPFLHRYVGNPLLSFISRRLFRTGCGDVYCGLRGFRRAAVLDLDLRSLGMEYAIEMVVKAKLSGLRVVETPTRLFPDARDRKPHLRTWQDGWRSLRLLLLYSPRWLFLYPGVTLAGVGAAVFFWLLPAQRIVGGVAFDVHTLFYAAVAIVIGVQAITFAVLANAFAISEGLLPVNAQLPVPFRWMTSAGAFVAGGLLTIAGFASSVAALEIWGHRSFGELHYSHTLRFVIPGGVSLALGCELLFAAFLMSLLELRRR